MQDTQNDSAELVSLRKIKELAAPGQELGISDAIDLICDIYNVARAALTPNAERG